MNCEEVDLQYDYNFGILITIPIMYFLLYIFFILAGNIITDSQVNIKNHQQNSR